MSIRRNSLRSLAPYGVRVTALEHKLAVHDGKLTTHDEAIAAVLSAIRELMAPPEPPKKRRIGWFIQSDD